MKQSEQCKIIQTLSFEMCILTDELKHAYEEAGRKTLTHTPTHTNSPCSFVTNAQLYIDLIFIINTLH